MEIKKNEEIEKDSQFENEASWHSCVRLNLAYPFLGKISSLSKAQAMQSNE